LTDFDLQDPGAFVGNESQSWLPYSVTGVAKVIEVGQVGHFLYL